MNADGGSGKAERGSLIVPRKRQTRVGQQLVRGQIAWLVAVEDGLDDVRGETAEANQQREIGWAHALPLGECRKRHTLAVDKSCVEPARLDQQFDQPSIGFRCRKWVSAVYPHLDLPPGSAQRNRQVKN